MERAIVNTLIRRGWHIAIAESCTGGLLSGRIVNVPDASVVLDVSFVTYSNEAKIKYLAVPPETIEKYGVVSPETAIAMAAGAAYAAGAEVGVGVTGYAGPSGGDEFAEKGTVCLGFWINGKACSKTIFHPELERNVLRELAAGEALAELSRLLEDKKQPECANGNKLK